MARRARRIFSRMCVILISLGSPPALLAQTFVTSSFDRVVATLPDETTGDPVSARLLRATASKLMTRSGTFAELVEALGAVSDVVLTMRPASLRGFLGLGHYHVVNGRIYGLLKVNPYPADPFLRVRALAHEVAHAFEIACLPRSDSAGLRRRLAERANGGPASASTFETFETPFADAIEKAVAQEWRRSRPGSAQFTTLVRRHGLEPCRPGADVTQIASAQP